MQLSTKHTRYFFLGCFLILFFLLSFYVDARDHDPRGSDGSSSGSGGSSNNSGSGSGSGGGISVSVSGGGTHAQTTNANLSPGAASAASQAAANALNDLGVTPSGHTSGGSWGPAVSKDFNGPGFNAGVEWNGPNEGGRDDDGPGGPGPRKPVGTTICLPDLVVGTLNFLDSSGALYAPTAVPANRALTPQVTFINRNTCGTNYLGTFKQNWIGGSEANLMVRNIQYQAWRTVGTNTAGSYPVLLDFNGLGYSNVLNNQGPTAGGGSTVVSFPPITFTLLGQQSVLIGADDPASCPGNPIPRNGVPWSGCISETGIFQTQTGNQGVIQKVSGSANEGNNTATRTITVVSSVIPIDPQCSNTTDDDGDTVSDSNDPGCHTDGDPTDPGTYDPTDDDETNGPNGPNGPNITANGQEGVVTVRANSPVVIDWYPNGGANCSLSSNLTDNTPSNTDNGTQTLSLQSETTFSINCTEGSSSVRVKVLPVMQES